MTSMMSSVITEYARRFAVVEGRQSRREALDTLEMAPDSITVQNNINNVSWGGGGWGIV